MTQPRLRATSMSLSAPDPRALAAFYSTLLGAEITASEPPSAGAPPEDGWAQLRLPEGLTLNFEYERGHVPPVWPSEPGSQQTQAHLDVQVDDLAGAVAWAEGVGARLAEHQPQDDVRVMLDPAGHPFCLFT
ncbi:VOC family protein [Actinokineospora guangxiensis]|uniref:VOC family protein n=1 Tax=Actinokineospora guangxiensis TaxID=1490288 RepID=A0ABW0EQD8_9PSEU